MNFSDLIKDIESSSSYREETVKAEVAHQILSSLHDLGYSQKDFSLAMGVKPSYLSRIVSATENLSIKTLVKIADALNKDVNIKFVDRASDKNARVPDAAMFASLVRAYDKGPHRGPIIIDSEWFDCAANAESFHMMDFSDAQAMIA